MSTEIIRATLLATCVWILASFVCVGMWSAYRIWGKNRVARHHHEAANRAANRDRGDLALWAEEMRKDDEWAELWAGEWRGGL